MVKQRGWTKCVQLGGFTEMVKQRGWTNCVQLWRFTEMVKQRGRTNCVQLWGLTDNGTPFCDTQSECPRNYSLYFLLTVRSSGAVVPNPDEQSETLIKLHVGRHQRNKRPINLGWSATMRTRMQARHPPSTSNRTLFLNNWYLVSVEHQVDLTEYQIAGCGDGRC